MTTLACELEKLIAAQLPALVALRHDLHAHPQLGYEETYASGVIQRELGAMGVEFQAGLAETGVVGWLPSRYADQPAIALRADMDALPIREATGLPYASTNADRMHACGHDGHTAILLGAARVLSQFQDHLPQPVKLIFQPAEETGGGGKKMVEAGALEGRIGGLPAGRVFALHGWPSLPLGTVATRPGPIMASMDSLTITLAGRGGHGAMPHLATDPLLAAAHLVTAIQSIVSRNVDPRDTAVVSICSMHAGATTNVIPSSAQLRGTIRALDESVRTLLHRRLNQLAKEVASGLGCTAVVEIEPGYPVTVNDPAATAALMRAAQAAGADLRLVTLDKPFTVSEDFAYFGQKAPSCFFFVGLRPADHQAYPEMHTPQFDFNDAAIGPAIRVLCALALGTPQNPVAHS